MSRPTGIGVRLNRGRTADIRSTTFVPIYDAVDRTMHECLAIVDWTAGERMASASLILAQDPDTRSSKGFHYEELDSELNTRFGPIGIPVTRDEGSGRVRLPFAALRRTMRWFLAMIRSALRDLDAVSSSAAPTVWFHSDASGVPGTDAAAQRVGASFADDVDDAIYGDVPLEPGTPLLPGIPRGGPSGARFRPTPIDIPFRAPVAVYDVTGVSQAEPSG